MAEFQLHQDALVYHLKPELGTPGNIIQLQGFLEETQTPGLWRLHAADFRSHVDIKQEDMIYAYQLDSDPRGGTIIYLRSSAIKNELDFLRGVIATMAMGRPILPG